MSLLLTLLVHTSRGLRRGIRVILPNAGLEGCDGNTQEGGTEQEQSNHYGGAPPPTQQSLTHTLPRPGVAPAVKRPHILELPLVVGIARPFIATGEGAQYGRLARSIEVSLSKGHVTTKFDDVSALCDAWVGANVGAIGIALIHI